MILKILLSFLIISFSHLSFSKVPNEPSSFVLYFQPLFTFENKASQDYLRQLKIILSHNDSLSFEKLLITIEESPICQSKKLPSCAEVLYSKSRCVPHNKIPSRYCLKRSGKIKQSFFQEPVFNRIQWNQLSLKLNRYCNENKNKICPELAKLHDKYMKKYWKIIKQRKKFRKKQK